jgi:hypothetical protein
VAKSSRPEPATHRNLFDVLHAFLTFLDLAALRVALTVLLLYGIYKFLRFVL